MKQLSKYSFLKKKIKCLDISSKIYNFASDF